MYYSKFSTKNADYELYYERHNRATTVEDLGSLDCVVLESGQVRSEYYRNANDNYRTVLLSIVYSEQYRNLLEDCEGNGKSVFLTDTPHTKEKLESHFQSIPPFFAHMLFFSGPPFLPPKKYTSKNIFKEIYTTLGELSLFYDSCRLRNAITAKKVEEFVAPEMTKRLGRKPRIGIVFGAAHNGMEASIKHKWLREGILKYHSMLEYSLIDKDYLNRVYELDFDDLRVFEEREEPKLKRHPVELFNNRQV